MVAWALCLRRSEATVLAKLHRVGDVAVGEADDSSGLVWARGAGSDVGLDGIVALVPTSRCYELLPGERLRPLGRLLPTGTLPKVSWVPLRQWLSIRAPSAALPGKLSGTATLRLVRDNSRRWCSGREEMLLCGVDVFREFLLRAPAHRLARLRFVLNDVTAEVLVRGEPLPSLPGDRFVLSDSVATPAGYAWSPAVGASVIRSWLGARDNTVSMWRADGSLSEIAQDAFVVASRPAGREL